jgi:hypothetical protein
MRMTSAGPAGEAAVHGPWGRTVFLRAVAVPQADAVRRLVDGLAAGECIAFAVPLNGAPVDRLMTLLTFRLRMRRIVRAMRDAGAEQMRRFGVDPDLEMPSCVYELDTDAAHYAERCLRPRGRFPMLRRALARIFGCDPALGAVVIIGRKARP